MIYAELQSFAAHAAAVLLVLKANLGTLHLHPSSFTAQSAAAQQVLACKLRWKLCDLANEPGTNMLSLRTAGVGVDYDEWLWYSGPPWKAYSNPV